MQKRCDGCVNYQRTGKADRHDPNTGFVVVECGQCRIGPPQPTTSLTAIADGRWPLVFADEWCGCFIEKDPAPATLPFPADRVGPLPRGGLCRDDLSCEPAAGRQDAPDVIPMTTGRMYGARSVPPGGGQT